MKPQDVILQKIPEIEARHNVKVLYMVESGSRAWGFESADSDYDVRFIYAHQKNWYLNILPKRDVIEYAIVDDFDYSGWDLRKAFFLLNKSNPTLFEWLKSPVVYYRDDYFYGVIAELAKVYFSPISSVYHYMHMAGGNYRQFLQGDEVKIKKYFYVLRPILACMWIEQHQEAPPMEFERLLTQITDAELLAQINELLIKKRAGVEMKLEPRMDSINAFIENRLEHFEKVARSFNPRKKPAQRILETGFIQILDYLEKQPIIMEK